MRPPCQDPAAPCCDCCSPCCDCCSPCTQQAQAHQRGGQRELRGATIHREQPADEDHEEDLHYLYPPWPSDEPTQCGHERAADGGHEERPCPCAGRRADVPE